MFKIQSTQGYQPKFTSSDGCYCYTEDLRGGEALAEVLVSTFLRACCNLTSYDYAVYNFVYRILND